MRKISHLLLLWCLVWSSTNDHHHIFVKAFPANPQPFEATQPNGDVITLRLIGNEVHHFLEDLEGYTVFHSPSHAYSYARLKEDGLLGPSRHHVGPNVNPAELGLHPHLRPTSTLCTGGHVCTGETPEEADEESDTRYLRQTNRITPEHRNLLTGTLKNLVIPIIFSDHHHRPRPSREDLDLLMNHDGPHEIAPTGSVRDVYLNNSYGLLTIESTVVDWIQLPNSEAYYADGDSGTEKLFEALRFALQKLDDDGLVTFSDFDEDDDGMIDAITFFHSGYGAETGVPDQYGTDYEDRIWSHKWEMWTGSWTSSDGVTVYQYHINPSLYGSSGTQITTIAVVSHETGHFLGLPDLYDSSNYLAESSRDYGSGIGSWGLMGNSWGFHDDSFHPPYLAAWARLELGWVEPVEPTPGGQILELEASALPLTPESSPKMYKIGDGKFGFPSGEYLLLENRQAYGYDEHIPSSGIAIWHIDEYAISPGTVEGHPGQSGWPGNGNHYRIALLQADGEYDLEKGYLGDGGDLYHAGGVSYLGPSVNLQGPYPNTDAYQFGNVEKTGVVIRDISSSADVMSFVFELDTSGTTTLAPGSASEDVSSITCTEEEGEFVLELTTDDFPGETTWQVTPLSNPNSVLLSGGPYHSFSSMTIEEVGCLPASNDYLFTIFDTHGDGICCGLWGDGSYNILWNGLETTTTPNPEFGEYEEIPFGRSYELLDIDEKTVPPGGNDGACKTLRVQVFTDDWPQETYWELTVAESGVVVWQGPETVDPKTLYDDSKCIESGVTYTFTIYDAVGDGICCWYGSGYYILELGGEEIQTTTGGTYGFLEETTFAA